MHPAVTFVFEDSIAYPDVQSIIAIHRAVYEASHSSDDAIALGPPNVGNIEGALHHVINHAGVRGPRRTRLITKAAHLMLRIMASHSFTDGNKRTAFITGMLFLSVNGITMRSVSLREYRRSLAFFRRAASARVNDEQTIRSLRQWIGRRVRDHEEPRAY